MRIERVVPRLVLDRVLDQVTLFLSHQMYRLLLHEVVVGCDTQVEHTLLEDLLALSKERNTLLYRNSVSKVNCEDGFTRTFCTLPAVLEEIRDNRKELSEEA